MSNQYSISLSERTTGTRDRGYTYNGTLNNGFRVCYLNPGIEVGYARFSGITLPKNAVITSAYLVLGDVNGSGYQASCTLKALALDDTSVGLTGSGISSASQITGGVKTTASVSWIQDLTGIANPQSPDISSIIQEVIDRPGWQPGNAITITADLNGSSVYTNSNTETLVINYTTDNTVVSFSYTGVIQNWTAPRDGVITAVLNGAGASGAVIGGKTVATFAVSQGDILSILAGGTNNGRLGGWNGGGDGGTGGGGPGEGGAGATDIRLNGVTLSDRILVAGGAGGQGHEGGLGGAGGGLSGQTGTTSTYASHGAPGVGGTQTTGYQLGQGGNGGGSGTSGGFCGSAGGGGYWGGTGGLWIDGGGGGGSGYIATTVNSKSTLNTSTVLGAGNIGDGDVTLFFSPGGITSVAVTDTNDDGYSWPNGPQTNKGMYTLAVNGGIDGFARFVNVDIPANATILSAKLDVNNITGYQVNYGQAWNTLYAAKSPNVPQPAVAGDVTNAVRTTANVVWHDTSNTLNKTTPDISAIIQEIIDQPDWASGNALMIIAVCPNASGSRDYQAADLSEILNVIYSLPSGPAVTLYKDGVEQTGVLSYLDGTTEIPITSAEFAP